MQTFIKNVFLMVIGVTVALLLYHIFFGLGAWEGLIWFASRAIETPISNYYYSYCYVPDIYSSAYVDKALGGAVVNNIMRIPANLSVGSTDIVDFSSSTYFCYSTGWK